MDDNSQRVVQLLEQLGSHQQQQQQHEPPFNSFEKARNIKTYPAAIRHVVDNVLIHGSIIETLKLLRQNQSVHEDQWLQARIAIERRHSQRSHLQSELDKILSMVGSSSSGGDDDTDIETQLSQYDDKVYKACTDMVNHMKRDLAQCGIPFFHTDSQSFHDSKTLVELQRKMLQFLDDYLAADDIL